MDVITGTVKYYFLKNRLINIFMSGIAFAFQPTHQILVNMHALPVIIKMIDQEYISNKFTYDDQVFLLGLYSFMRNNQ